MLHNWTNCLSQTQNEKIVTIWVDKCHPDEADEIGLQGNDWLEEPYAATCYGPEKQGFNISFEKNTI